MGSTHPPLESLLKLSQNCLEGFELSRLNRISNLRKEFEQILAEWIDFEIEARFARWVLEYRRVFDSFANQAALPAFVPPPHLLRSVTHSDEEPLLRSGDDLPIEFPFVSMVELRDSAAFELRLPLPHLPVSQNASAALHSLEHFAHCEAQAMGDQPIDLLDFDVRDSSRSCPFLPFPQSEPVHEIRNVSSRMTYVLAGTNQSAHCVVRYTSTFVTSDRATPMESIAQSKLSLFPGSRPRESGLRSEGACALRRSQSDLGRPSPFQLSLHEYSLRLAVSSLCN
jgi:hypothetical protein